MDGTTRHLAVIGIGSGDPDQLTLAAVKAMRTTDVFFILDKGREKASLVRLRHDMLDEHASGSHRIVEADDPWRDRAQDASSGYREAVHDWRRRRADLCEGLIRDELAPGQRGAFLVWGDPSLYDSTLAVLESIAARGNVTFTYEVIPGVSSVSTLAARHRIGLNRVGRPLHITPGRQLSETLGAIGNDDGDVVVMLDAHESFRHLSGEGTWIYWGAYLGTPDEILVSGPLGEVADEIRRARAEARATHGWIMDTYLLRPLAEVATP
ncbi:precorrin-6A synthase (deacetylating) [Streptomyces sp. NPDC004435]|uniref:precorrin-6A synthase (deacetylating) n=1 Tax=Streptomyces sp. NPDC004435 TaxID=3364701 RepID=UPI0036A4A96B